MAVTYEAVRAVRRGTSTWMARRFGAKVAVTLADGTVNHQTFVVGEGLCSDQSHILNFGLGQQIATAVSVLFLDGSTVDQNGTFKNQILSLEPPNDPAPSQSAQVEGIQ